MGFIDFNFIYIIIHSMLLSMPNRPGALLLGGLLTSCKRRGRILGVNGLWIDEVEKGKRIFVFFPDSLYITETTYLHGRNCFEALSALALPIPRWIFWC